MNNTQHAHARCVMPASNCSVKCISRTSNCSYHYEYVATAAGSIVSYYYYYTLYVCQKTKVYNEYIQNFAIKVTSYDM